MSKSTVSNVVRGAEDVSAHTRARVLEAIARLDYLPNAIARQFVTQRTTTIGVLVGDLDNPYYAQMSRVVERSAFQLGYTAMFCNIEGEDDLALAGVEALLAQRVAGVIFLAFVARTAQLERALKRAAIPIVSVGLHERWDDSVGPRDNDGGRLATEHLLELGHRRIAYVRTPLVDVSGDRARFAGYRAAMRAASLPVRTLGWRPGAASIRDGRRRVALERTLRGPEAVSAMFVSNDIGAVAMIEACESVGIQVPRDVSVVGFDDIALAGLHRISLTTIAQPLELQAERAVSMLLDRVEAPDRRARRVSVPVTLRVRGSSAPAATDAR